MNDSKPGSPASCRITAQITTQRTHGAAEGRPDAPVTVHSFGCAASGFTAALAAGIIGVLLAGVGLSAFVIAIVAVPVAICAAVAARLLRPGSRRAGSEPIPIKGVVVNRAPSSSATNDPAPKALPQPPAQRPPNGEGM